MAYREMLARDRSRFADARIRMNESPLGSAALAGTGFALDRDRTAAALGFLGLGAPPPTPEWGRMIAESREFLPEAWWYATVPGVAIFMVVMGFNLLGDGLRDFLDPRIRRGAGVK